MGWSFSSEWKSRQDVLDYWFYSTIDSGYKVEMQGSWFYAEKDGKPVDLIYLLTKKVGGEWGYKALSVTSGPLCYTAPLDMVLKIHLLFKDDRYYQGWLDKYPKRSAVLRKQEEAVTEPLFKEAS